MDLHTENVKKKDFVEVSKMENFKNQQADLHNENLKKIDFVEVNKIENFEIDKNPKKKKIYLNINNDKKKKIKF